MTKAAADRKVQELGIFHDVAKALTSSLDLDSILQTIMEKMAEYFRPETWSLLMVDEQKDELYFAIAVGAAAEVLANARVKMGEGVTGWVAEHQSPVALRPWNAAGTRPDPGVDRRPSGSVHRKGPPLQPRPEDREADSAASTRPGN